MAFDANGYIREARNAGIDPEVIDATLVKNGGKSIGPLRKFVEGPAIPLIGGGLGLLGGLALSPVTAGASVPFGGIAGAGAATALKHSLSDILGYQTKTPKEQLGEAGTNVATAGTLGEMYNIGQTLLAPKYSMGNVRSTAIGNKSIPNADLQRQSLKNLYANPRYQEAPADIKPIAESELADFTNRLNEYNPSGSINTTYGRLPSFENTGASNVYQGASPIEQGRTLSSQAIRSVLTQNIPWVAKRSNDVMGFVAKNKKLLAGFGIGVPALGAIYTAIKGLLRKK